MGSIPGEEEEIRVRVGAVQEGTLHRDLSDKTLVWHHYKRGDKTLGIVSSAKVLVSIKECKGNEVGLNSLL